MVRCKNTFGIVQDIESRWIKNAKLPGITACYQSLYAPKGIPLVTDLVLDNTLSDVTVTWHANPNYYTEFQYRTADGRWKTIILDKGIGSL